MTKSAWIRRRRLAAAVHAATVTGPTGAPGRAVIFSWRQQAVQCQQLTPLRYVASP